MHEIKNRPPIESVCGINEYLICMSSVMRERVLVNALATWKRETNKQKEGYTPCKIKSFRVIFYFYYLFS